MKMRVFIYFLVIALFLPVCANAEIVYQIIDLGTLGGSNSYARSINDRGQIVGGAHDSSGQRHACLFDATGGRNNIDLDPIGEYPSHAFSINNNGQIVGEAKARACLFDPTGGGANIDLGTLVYGDGGRARSINDKGQIVGCSQNLYGTNRACLFDPTGGGDNIDLGSVGEPSFLNISHAYSINDSGQIVGAAGRPFHACLFDPTGGGDNIDLGSLGGTHSAAYSVNNNGQIVGYAWWWQFGVPVGHRACLFDPTGQGNNIDLNTLIDPHSGWTLKYAYSINNHGWIVGTGINPDSSYHAYLLIPEPATIALLGLGILCLRKRRK